MSKERIDKILSHEGFGSRKDIKKLLRTSEVLVNGKQIFDPGFQINAESDLISIDGEEIDLHQNIYLMMNKIIQTVCTTKDGEHQTVFDLLDDEFHTPYLQDKLHLVGRLDMDTEGLLLFTTDGALTHRLISPKTHVSKTYFVVLEHAESSEHQKEICNEFRKGIHIAAEDNDPEADCQSAELVWPEKDECLRNLEQSNYFDPEFCAMNGLELSERENFDPSRAALLTIYEGKYHQVKRMFSAVGNKVIYLKRISIGQLKLDKTLEPGEYRYMDEKDLEKLV